MDKKVLIITHHRPNRSPGQRFRFEQYLDFLSKNGYSFDWDILLNQKQDRIFYKGAIISKFLLIISLFFKRAKTIQKVKQYDIIFIYREVFVIGGAFFERAIAKRNPNIIFDYDDAIWLQDVSEKNKKFKFLKNSAKTKDIIAVSKAITTGNNYLANYAKQFNTNVFVLPTTIDTNYHNSNSLKNKNCITIGWTGTSTTLRYFEELLPVLVQLKFKYKELLQFQIIVDVNKHYPDIDTNTTLWSLNSEIEDLNKIDIGIMPLPNDEWTKGKCGFKGLQYMSLKIPTIMSPVGVNSEIIQHSNNGFLASSNHEWINILSQLIESEDLRKKIGNNGYQTILKNYSVTANKEKYLSVFDSI